MPTPRLLRSVMIACLLAGLCAPAIAGPPPQAMPDEGKKVIVTATMRGAGAVSSGVRLPTPPAATGTRERPVQSWGKPLPYPIVIADRRNNRLIEISPDKRIIWELPSPDLALYRGNDDVFFSPDGKTLVVNEEDNFDIHMINYADRTISWNWGMPDHKGSGPNTFNYPDDTHLLPDGMVVTADIRNCRIVFIDPKKAEMTEQWGKPGDCRHDPPRALNLPNGVTPLDNGDFLITEIPDAWITRITRKGEVVWAMKGPHLRYPSDAYPTQDGQVIVADYVKPGGIVIFDPKTGKVTWEYRPKSGETMMDHPSLAMELPTGDILLNDDLRHRVLVIDRVTKAIIWQYGITDTPGHKPGSLFYPDGFDLDVFHDWKAELAKK